MDLLQEDLREMARKWRKCREPFLSMGRDNSIESQDFEEELEEFERYLLSLKYGKQISHEDYCRIWSSVREEWEIFALKAIEYSERDPVEEQSELDKTEVKELLHFIAKQQQEIVGLLKKLVEKE